MSSPRANDRVRFDGEICGIGTTSGHRIVVGRWVSTPFGPFADVMHQAPDGTRTLFAPEQRVAEFITETYRFDDVRLVDVDAVRSTDELVVEAGPVMVRVAIGGRSPLGRVLHAMPRSIATSPIWCRLVDPFARVVLRGVRTAGTAGNGRTEWYGATDQHRVRSVVASFDGDDLGSLADVWPPVSFGFSSTPRRPSIVSTTTSIRIS